MEAKTGAAVGIAILLLIGGGAAYYATRDKAPDAPSTAFISDNAAQRLAEGYLALIFDDGNWNEVSPEGLTKNHGIGHAASPCPDFFAPFIIRFPDNLNPPPSNLALNPGGDRWFSFPPQVAIPPDGIPTFPADFPQPPPGFYSQPFFVNFNCNIPSPTTQELNGNLNITIYNADNTEYRPGFKIPLKVNVFAAADYPTDEALTDGFEPIPPNCSNFAMPVSTCFDFITVP